MKNHSKINFKTKLKSKLKIAKFAKSNKARLYKVISYKSIANIIVCVVVCVVLGVFLFFYTSLKPLYFEPESLVSFDKNGELLSLFVNQNENFKISIDAQKEHIPKMLQDFVLLYEDKRFLSHFGVDMLSIARAAKSNLMNFASQSKPQGASTISMQAIKLGMHNPNRDIATKIQESLQAVRLEWNLPKEHIFRLYVDNAPYGNNIIGIKTASLLYFDKPLARLSPAQIAFLAVLPNAPNLLQQNPQKLRAKRDNLLLRAKNASLIDELTYKLSILEPLPSLHRQNSIAPHYTMFLAKTFPDRKVFYTHIDKSIQIRFESLAKNYAQTLQPQQIRNLAFVLIGAEDKNIIAYVGSQDFYDLANYGQVDGIQAKRNVGSTLKPFLYALSLDEGLITPQTKLLDMNAFFGNFNPQNSSLRFSNNQSALYALRQSLNVPFVNLLNDYGQERFFYFLRQNLGFADMEYKRYGLSLILGAKELSLFDLSKLYLGLRRGGDFAELQLEQKSTPQDTAKQNTSKDEPKNIKNVSATQNTSQNPQNLESKHVHLDSLLQNQTPKKDKDISKDFIDYTPQTPISKEAAFMTLQDLLDIYLDVSSMRIASKIAWKSGTSFGNYDSWALGVSDRYILGVWAGNFNAKSSVALTGRGVAGKMMFEIFEVLESIEPLREFQDFKEIGLWSNTPKMREVRIDSNGYRTLQEPYTIAYMPAFAKPLRLAPQAFIHKNDLKIIYPSQGILLQQNKHNKVVAKLHTQKSLDSNQGSEVYYFLNGEFIGQNSRSHITLKPQNGKNTLYVINQNGQSDEVEFYAITR